jgi:DNA-binding transcriptional regulator YdaS (Cro superfamily)/membrane-associated protease RseP (regulator of RpoE activity)
MNKQIKDFLFILVTALVIGCVAPTTQRVKPNEEAVAVEADIQREIAFKEAINSQQRLYKIGAPILKKSLTFCNDKQTKAIGITYANKYDFEGEFQNIAVSKLGLSTTLQITYIFDSYPAEEAGLRTGDILLSINGEDIPEGKDASKRFSELLKKEIKNNEQLLFQIVRNGVIESLVIFPVKICNYPLIVTNDVIVNAFADGSNIFITQGMMDFAKSDDELALVVSHELAHNTMRHIDAKKTNALGGFVLDMLIGVFTGVNTQGMFAKSFAQAYSKEFESEADYVGLYMCELSGYDISDAAYFWRRMGVKHPGTIAQNHGASHPSPPERFVSIESTIKEIEQKKLANEILTPNINEDVILSRNPPPDSAANKIGF